MFSEVNKESGQWIESVTDWAIRSIPDLMDKKSRNFDQTSGISYFYNSI